MLEIFHRNALYLLAFVSLEIDVSCVSLYGFLFWSGDLPNMVMITENEGHLQKKTNMAKNYTQDTKRVHDMSVRSHS